MALAVGGISGGAFNPAVGTGPHIIRLMAANAGYKNFWVYWVGPLIGAALAALFFRLTNVPEYVLEIQEEMKVQKRASSTMSFLDQDQSTYYPGTVLQNMQIGDDML